MSESSFTMRLCLVTLALAGATFLAAPETQAITYGEPDCDDIATNTNCSHPNTVTLVGFGPRPRRLVSNVRGSGTLLAANADRFVILTAAHVNSFFLSRFETGQITTIGVSFDAKNVIDLPWIGPLSSSPDQFLLGGQPVINSEYGPQARAWNVRDDYGVIVFDIPEAQRFTAGGEFVDLSGIAPVNLPELDYMADKVGPHDGVPLTFVGYGLGKLLYGPGEGGNGGNQPELTGFEKVGERWMTETSAHHFMNGLDLLYTSQNPATGDAGGCYGDSGGPLFHIDQEGVEFQVAIASSGDPNCRANGFSTRTDTANAIDFIACVQAGAEIEDILACGCTEVNEEGVCPAE